jgi:hypothetical protein
MANERYFTVDCPKQSSVPINEYKIFGPNGRELMIVKGPIKIEDVRKAAVCAKISPFSAFRNGSIGKLMIMDFPVASDIVITPLAAISNPLIKYSVFRGSDKKLLNVVGDVITKEVMDKAAKCAGFTKGYMAFDKNGIEFKTDASVRIKCDVYLREKPTRKPQVFNVCESTSVAPVKKPVKSTAISKQKLIKDAIKGLESASLSLRKLEKLI